LQASVRKGHYNFVAVADFTGYEHSRNGPAQLVANGGSDLVTGSAVSLELASAARRVLAVPRSAVGDDGYVVVLSSQRATLRPVVTGPTHGEQVEILSGLQAGERIRRKPR
jgi:multidrug efflux pump subunit AcrA (membrane-fusion protein)